MFRFLNLLQGFLIFFVSFNKLQICVMFQICVMLLAF